MRSTQRCFNEMAGTAGMSVQQLANRLADSSGAVVHIRVGETIREAIARACGDSLLGYRRATFLGLTENPADHEYFTLTLTGSETEPDVTHLFEFIESGHEPEQECPAEDGPHTIEIGVALGNTLDNMAEYDFVTPTGNNLAWDGGCFGLAVDNADGYTRIVLDSSGMAGVGLNVLEWVREPDSDHISVLVGGGTYDEGRIGVPPDVDLVAIVPGTVHVVGGCDVVSDSAIVGIDFDSADDLSYGADMCIHLSAAYEDSANVRIEQCKANSPTWAFWAESGVSEHTITGLILRNNHLTSGNPIFVNGAELVGAMIESNTLRKLTDVGANGCNAWMDVSTGNAAVGVYKSRDNVLRNNYAQLLGVGGTNYGFYLCGYAWDVHGNYFETVAGLHVVGFGDAVAASADTLRANRVAGNTFVMTACGTNVWAVDISKHDGSGDAVTRAAPLELGRNVFRGVGATTPKRIRAKQTYSQAHNVITLLPGALDGWDGPSNTDSLAETDVGTWSGPG